MIKDIVINIKETENYFLCSAFLDYLKNGDGYAHSPENIQGPVKFVVEKFNPQTNIAREIERFKSQFPTVNCWLFQKRV